MLNIGCGFAGRSDLRPGEISVRSNTWSGAPLVWRSTFLTHRSFTSASKVENARLLLIALCLLCHTLVVAHLLLRHPCGSESSAQTGRLYLRRFDSV